MNDKVLPIVTRNHGLFVINKEILPAKCNKPDIINSLYRYIVQKYSFTNGQFKVIDINRDLMDLLKREGLL
jgi:hypothetical protein